MKKRFNTLILSAIGIIAILIPSDLHPFGKNKVNRDIFQWNIMKTIHFDIYYAYGMEELALYSAKIAEEGYVHIANYLNHELTQVVPVIIYPSHIDFQENNILQQMIGEGTGGFTEAFKNRIVIPFTGSYREYRHVLTHELVHAFQYNIMFDDTSGQSLLRFSYNAGPILWLMEGMAEYLSIGYDETADMVMRDILYNEKYATLMDLAELRIENPYLLYKEGQSFYYFLEKQYGRNEIGELFRDIRDIGNLDEAMRIHTGKTLEELNLDWIRFFKKRYFSLVKTKNFDEEEGEQYTYHLKTESSFNVCPAVSPDGKKIAYITNMDIYSTISILNIAKKEERQISAVLQGDTSATFEGMHLLSNNLTWSSDGKYLVFVSQSKGRDVIFIIDSNRGKVINQFKFPFRAIMDPSFSRDGKMIAFIGQGNNSSDVYIYNIENNDLTAITSDLYSKRYPKISSDNSFLLFSSNINSDNDYEKDDYNIIKYDLKTKKQSAIISFAGNDLQADISPDNRYVLYISNRTGIYNIYKYDMDKGQDARITDVICGVFYPRWFPEEKRIAFTAYQNQGYDIFVKDISASEKPASSEIDTQYYRIKYGASYFNLSGSAFEDYKTRMSPDFIFFGIGGTIGYGFAGFARIGISDYLGEHQIIVGADYLYYDKDNNNFNFDGAYYYLKYRWDFGIGIFRQKSPYGLLTLNTINDIINNTYFDTVYVDHYGVYGIASYPFSKFFRFDIRATSSRYETDYTVSSRRPDTYANLNQLALSLNFDNVLWGYMVPVDGIRGQIEVEQSFNLTGHDFQFTAVNIDIRRYFLLSKRYVFALRGSGGKVFGKDSDYFKYYIGGFNSLRGHPFLEYSGGNFFLGSCEFRFTAINGLHILGEPFLYRMGGIGGVLFVDFGSAWDKNYHFMDPKTGDFGDFKADAGFGFRLTLYPLIILKLDYAWPYYYKYFGDMQITFSLGFEF